MQATSPGSTGKVGRAHSGRWGQPGPTSHPISRLNTLNSTSSNLSALYTMASMEATPPPPPHRSSSSSHLPSPWGPATGGAASQQLPPTPSSRSRLPSRSQVPELGPSPSTVASLAAAFGSTEGVPQLDRTISRIPSGKALLTASSTAGAQADELAGSSRRLSRRTSGIPSLQDEPSFTGAPAAAGACAPGSSSTTISPRLQSQEVAAGRVSPGASTLRSEQSLAALARAYRNASDAGGLTSPRYSSTSRIPSLNSNLLSGGSTPTISGQQRRRQTDTSNPLSSIERQASGLPGAPGLPPRAGSMTLPAMMLPAQQQQPAQGSSRLSSTSRLQSRTLDDGSLAGDRLRVLEHELAVAQQQLADKEQQLGVLEQVGGWAGVTCLCDHMSHACMHVGPVCDCRRALPVHLLLVSVCSKCSMP